MQIDVIRLAEIFGAISIIVGFLYTLFRFIEKQKKNEREIKNIKKENALICEGLIGCLDGLEQLGARSCRSISTKPRTMRNKKGWYI